MNAEAIAQRARELGVTLTAAGDKIRYAPKSATPPAFVDALRKHKAEVLAYLREPSFQCWILEEWRRMSIPEWRCILNESQQQGDRTREEYARWMLREVLLDPEYRESGP